MYPSLLFVHSTVVPKRGGGGQNTKSIDTRTVELMDGLSYLRDSPLDLPQDGVVGRRGLDYELLLLDRNIERDTCVAGI